MRKWLEDIWYDELSDNQRTAVIAILAAGGYELILGTLRVLGRLVVGE